MNKTVAMDVLRDLEDYINENWNEVAYRKDIEVTYLSSIINHVEVFIMNAVEYLKEANRLCKTVRDCKNCPIEKINNFCYPCRSSSQMLESMNPEKCVEIVEKWSKENPVKTRQSELLKMFPNAPISEDSGVLTLCPRKIDTVTITIEMCEDSQCDTCQKSYWMHPIYD